MVSCNRKKMFVRHLKFVDIISFFIFIFQAVFMSCTHDYYGEFMGDENNGIVLSVSSDSIGITGGGTDFGFDDDDEPPATSIHNPTVD